MVLLLALIIVGKAQTPLLSEGFEEGIPDSWTVIDADGDGNEWLAGTTGDDPANARTGTGYAYSRSWLSGAPNGGALTPDNWLITDAINLPGTSTYEISFWVCSMQDNYPAEHYGIYVTTNSNYTTTSNYTLLYEETLESNNGESTQSDWQYKHVRLTGYTGPVHIAIRHFNCSDQVAIVIDDITVDVAQPVFECNATSIHFPTGTVGESFPTGKITINGANLSEALTLTMPANTPFGISTDSVNYSNQISLPINAMGDIDNTGIYVRFNPTAVGYYETTLTLSTTGLASKTVNLYGIAVDCSQYQTIPWYENFSNTYFPPACWRIDATDSIVSSTNTDGTSNYEYTWFKFGAGAAVRGDENNLQDEHFYSPTFDLSNASGATDFSFGIRTNPNIEALVNGDISMTVKMSTNGGNSYTTIWDIQDCREAYSEVWTSAWPVWPVSVNMDQYIGSNSLLKFDFHYEAAVGAADQFIIRDLQFTNFFDPRLKVSAEDTIRFFSYIGNPETIIIPVEGRNLTQAISVSVNTPYEVSLDGTSFTNTVNMPMLGGNLYVRYNPTEGGNHNGVLTLTSNYSNASQSFADTTFLTTIVLVGNSYNCSSVVLPIVESFESEEGTVLAPNTTEYCWNAISVNTADLQNALVNSNDYAYTGSQSFRFSSTYFNAQQIYDQYLISPEITSTEALLVMFNYANGSVLKDEVFSVGYSTTGNNLSDFTWEADITNSANTDWQLYRNTNVPANVKYVAIHYKSNRGTYLYIDNFKIMVVPSCLFPVSLKAENTGIDHADITWTAGASETSWQMAYGVAPLNLDAATPVLVNTLGTTINGLNANTHYQVALRAVCGNSYSDWSEIADFWTTTTPATVPYTQTFEDNDADRNNWVLVNGNEQNYFMYGNIPGSTTGKALMITQDGSTNTYLTQVAEETLTSHYSTVWAYRDVLFSETTSAGYLLTFNWKCFGEVDYDFGELFIGNATEVTNFERDEHIPGYVDVNTTHYTPAGLTKLGRFENKTSIQNATYIIPAEGNAGQIKRLYFLWTNDSLSGSETPLAIDNISITIPQFANISGMVVDANTNAPIANATIYMESNQGLTATTTSASDGSYTISNLVASYYSIEVRAAGYQTLNTGYILAEGDNTLNLEMSIEECAIIPSNVYYTVEEDNMILHWDAVVDQTIQLCSDNLQGYLGASSATTYSCGAAHLYTPSDLTTVNGGTITSIGVQVHCEAQYCDYSVRIYVGGDNTEGPASMVYEQVINPETVVISGWTDVVLDEPYVIDGSQNLWIGYYASVHAPASGSTYYPLWISTDCQVPGYSDLLLWSGDWEAYGKDFMIRADVNAPDVTYSVYEDGILIASELSGEDIYENGYVVSPYDPTACYQIRTTCENGEVSNVSECAVGINDVDNVTSFEVYPNPAHETVTVSTTMNAQKVEVLNYLGQVIYSHNVSGNTFTLNVANYADGVYFIRLTGDEGIATQKLIKR